MGKEKMLKFGNTIAPSAVESNLVRRGGLLNGNDAYLNDNGAAFETTVRSGILLSDCHP